MEDQLISFETAKLAKEKGYQHHFIGLFYNDGGELNSLLITEPVDIHAPTQSLLQRWLREEKRLFITVIISDDHEYIVEPMFRIEIREHRYQMLRRFKTDFQFRNYEGALEAALVEALKLLKSSQVAPGTGN